ncbi:MAG: hypothetical protein KDK36_11555 [Leptospiraceae bacterium]|nr:hypothetical protein [Leptospiraceae bacterium]
MKFLNLMILGSILLILNCATSSAGLATSNIPIVNKEYDVIGPVEGKKGWITVDLAIIGVPLNEPPMHALVDELITKNDADALINIKYWNDKMVFPIITYNRIGINAEAVKFKGDTSGNVKKRR